MKSAEIQIKIKKELIQQIEGIYQARHTII
jgi:hypothetical protein